MLVGISKVNNWSEVSNVQSGSENLLAKKRVHGFPMTTGPACMMHYRFVMWHSWVADIMVMRLTEIGN